MSETKSKLVRGKDTLRVALDGKAAEAYALMTERLKQESPHIKIHPSQFVSFLVSDYYRSYFEKDLSVLVAEFFDAHVFYNAELQKAKKGDFEEVMDSALAYIKRVKARRRKAARPPNRDTEDV